MFKEVYVVTCETTPAYQRGDVQTYFSLKGVFATKEGADEYVKREEKTASKMKSLETCYYDIEPMEIEDD